jgi:hypothetical protein
MIGPTVNRSKLSSHQRVLTAILEFESGGAVARGFDYIGTHRRARHRPKGCDKIRSRPRSLAARLRGRCAMSSKRAVIVSPTWEPFYNETAIPAAVRIGGLLHVSGHTGEDQDGRFPAQIEAQIRVPSQSGRVTGLGWGRLARCGLTDVILRCSARRGGHRAPGRRRIPEAAFPSLDRRRGDRALAAGSGHRGQLHCDDRRGHSLSQDERRAARAVEWRSLAPRGADPFHEERQPPLRLKRG